LVHRNAEKALVLVLPSVTFEILIGASLDSFKVFDPLSRSSSSQALSPRHVLGLSDEEGNHQEGGQNQDEGEKTFT